MSSELTAHDKAVINCIFNPNLPVTDVKIEELTEVHLKDEEGDHPDLEKVHLIEIEAVNHAEKGNYKKALDLLNNGINILPQKASLYNNRARVYQFIEKFEDAFDDLNKCILIAEDKQYKTLCQSLCQRGLLHRKYNRAELARTDFNRAAEMGSSFAKSQLVELNPYAALCNDMLRKVMENLD